MKEHWQMIKGYPNYAISSFGRVRNLNTGRVLKHQSSKRGGNYAFVNLCKYGDRENINVHILVAEAFLGPQPTGTIVHHKDTNRMNPRKDNLEYKTHQQNRRMQKSTQSGNSIMKLCELSTKEYQLVIGELAERIKDIVYIKCRFQARQVLDNYYRVELSGDDELRITFTFTFIWNDLIQIVGRKRRAKQEASKQQL